MRKLQTAGTVQMILGGVIAGFFGLITIVGFFTSVVETHNDYKLSDLIMVLICLTVASLGGLLILMGYRKKQLAGMFYDYRARLLGDPEKSIEHLADTLNVPREIAEKNLQKMIELGLFPDMYIDRSRNSVAVGTQNDEPEM